MKTSSRDTARAFRQYLIFHTFKIYLECTDIKISLCDTLVVTLLRRASVCARDLNQPRSEIEINDKIVESSLRREKLSSLKLFY